MVAELGPISHRSKVLLALLCGLIIGAVAYVVAHPVALTGYDFEAFWCSGNGLLVHANPYLNEPLHTCEATTSPAFFLHYPQVTVPVPLPGYAIAFFTPFALLPFAVSRALWLALQIACTFAIARGISKITGMPPITATFASAVAVLAPAILQGALAPIPITLTLFGALALQRERWNWAAILLGMAMIEPHMVLPVCAAVFFFIPPMRWRLLVAAMCALGATLLALGPHVALSYFTTVLPSHAASEVNNLGQYSLTVLLYHLGVAPALALRAGSIQYAIFAVGSIAVARALFARDGDRAWLVLVPAAFAVTGGAFIHLAEVAMAVPLACLVAMRRPGTAPWVVVTMLALPLESIVDWIPLAVPAAMAGVWFVTSPHLRAQRWVRNGVVPISAVLLFIAMVIAHFVMAPQAQQAVTHAVMFPEPEATASASVTWAAYNALARTSVLWWPEKLWTLVPLVSLIVICMREAVPEQRSHRRAGGTSAPTVEC